MACATIVTAYWFEVSTNTSAGLLWICHFIPHNGFVMFYGWNTPMLAQMWFRPNFWLVCLLNNSKACGLLTKGFSSSVRIMQQKTFKWYSLSDLGYIYIYMLGRFISVQWVMRLWSRIKYVKQNFLTSPSGLSPMTPGPSIWSTASLKAGVEGTNRSP